MQTLFQESQGTTEIAISEIKITGPRFRKDYGKLEDLMNSIRSVGLLHPIVINEDNELIAGGRRIEACKKLGFSSISFHRISLKDILRGELEENTIRKDFTPSEAVAIRKALACLVATPEGRPRKTSVNYTSFPKGRTTTKVSKYLGISERTLDKATAIVEAAEKKPKRLGRLVEKLDTGRLSIDGAYRQFKRIEREDNFIPVKIPESVSIEIRNSDFHNAFEEVSDNEIDLVLTDPQYHHSEIESWKVLGELGSKKLKPSSFLVAYSGVLYIPDVLGRLQKHLVYRWTIALLYKNANYRTNLKEHSIMQGWKPIFVFQKPPTTRLVLKDVLEGAGRAKEDDDMGQNVEELRGLLEIFSKPGDKVLEPFAGGGTTIQACLEKKRNCVAYEIETSKYNSLVRRFPQKS